MADKLRKFLLKQKLKKIIKKRNSLNYGPKDKVKGNYSLQMYDDYDDFRFRRYEEKSTVSHFQIMKHFTKLTYLPLPS
jgi:hypothetical protein